MRCVVCGHASLRQVYSSAQAVSITSLSKPLNAKTAVHYCPACSHLYTPPVLDVEQYYDQSYNINTATDDEDQLYAIVKGKPVYRSEHQARALVDKLDLPQGARILDYGCGPAHTTRTLARQRPDLSIHLFDVSENYKPTWQRWLDERQAACYQPPEAWDGSFDRVVSFFALEHTDDPRGFAQTLYRLLKPGGKAYLLVPNVYDNIADLIVVDHLNHFSDLSLCTLLQTAGFHVRYLSPADHSSAWTVVAQRPEGDADTEQPIDPKQLQQNTQRVDDMAAFWHRCDQQVTAFEQANNSPAASIYGSGFYGCYLYTRLAQPDAIESFIDRNPHQQKNKRFGRPVLDPPALSHAPRLIWVGLNPRIAKDAIAGLEAWHDRPYTYFYL